MQNSFYIFLILFLFFNGCSSKKYFEPERVDGNVEYNGKLDSYIFQVKSNGATLENGTFISKNLPINQKLPDGFLFLNETQGKFIATKDRELLILDKERETRIILDSRVLNAILDNQKLIGIFADNTIFVLDISKKEYLFKQKEEDVFGIDYRVANPYLLSDLILFPTLDGKVVIIDKDTYKPIRNIVVSSGRAFNNIIFLDVVDNRLIAATQSKLVSVSPEIINSKQFDIRDISLIDKNIFLTTKNGEIIKIDIDLNKQKSIKFPFAHFVGLIYGKYIYAVEKEGYIVATDEDLNTKMVYELDDELESEVYSFSNSFFYEDTYFELKK